MRKKTDRKKVLEAIELYVFGIPFDGAEMGIISHPIVTSVFEPKPNAHKEVDKPLEERMWRVTAETFDDVVNKKWTYIKKNIKSIVSLISFVIHKPYRLPILLDCYKYLSDDDFHELVRDVWEMVEFPHQGNERRKIVSMLSKVDPLKVMDDKEKKVYDALPDTIEAYRGVNSLGGRKVTINGLSWTLSKDKAIWFAKRFSKENKMGVYQASIPKSAVFWYSNSREEQELVVNPFEIKVSKYPLRI